LKQTTTSRFLLGIDQVGLNDLLQLASICNGQLRIGLIYMSNEELISFLESLRVELVEDCRLVAASVIDLAVERIRGIDVNEETTDQS
jgi:hypothetical protein